jgi:hypothetical protein
MTVAVLAMNMHDRRELRAEMVADGVFDLLDPR